jgi:hypothetical protein
MANLSHIVNHLSFGPVLSNSAIKYILSLLISLLSHSLFRKLESVPDDYFSYSSTHPMDNRFYMNEKLHQTFHHHLKVVPTTLELGGKHSVRNPANILTYQMVQSAQMMQVSLSPPFPCSLSYALSPVLRR